MIKSLCTSSLKFPVPMMTYKLIPPLPTKLFNFDKFLSNLQLQIFLPNSESLLCKYNNSPFAYRHHEHIVIRDLQIMKNKFFRNEGLNIKTLDL